MFPAPTTIAISRPREWTSSSSSAIDSTVGRSIPNGFEPIRASPESLSKIRPNAGAASDVTSAPSASGRLMAASSAGHGEALELEHLGAGLRERLPDGLARVVDPRLVGEHLRGEEALVQHSLDDLLTSLLRLRLDLVRVGVDLALGRHDLPGNVLPADPPWSRGGNVHRDEAAKLSVAAADLDEGAELVCRRVRVAGDQAAVYGLEARGADDPDVLTQLGNELDSLFFQLLEGLGALRLDKPERLLGEPEELLVVRDRLGLAADADDRALPGVVGERVPDLALRRLAARALGGLPQAAFAQELLSGLDVAARLDERALAIHHSRAGQLAELLDESG